MGARHLMLGHPAMRGFRDVQMRHIFREVNCVADLIAFLRHRLPPEQLQSHPELIILIQNMLLDGGQAVLDSIQIITAPKPTKPTYD